MKNINSKIISALLLIVFCLTACANPPAAKDALPDDAPRADMLPEASSSLVLYDYPGQTELLKKAIAVFERDYPHVAVEFSTFGDLSESSAINRFYEEFYTQLESGSGPDVVLMGADAMWLQTLKWDIYADLDSFIGRDGEFVMSEYNEAAFDTGIFRETRRSVPVFFKSELWLTTQEILDANGITLTDGALKLEELSTQMEAFRLAHPNKRLIIDTVSGRMLNKLLPWYGLPLVDYAQETVTANADELRPVVDFYKDYLYEHDRVNPPAIFPTLGMPIINGECVFMRFSRFEELMMAYAGLKSRGTPVLVSCPPLDSQTVGEPTLFAQILKNSPNQENAYNFLKILLSDEIQSDIESTSFSIALPIKRSAMDAKAQRIAAELCPPGKSTRYAPVEFAQLTDQDISSITQMAYDIDRFVVDPLWFEASIAMLPYFEGTSTYEICFESFVEQASFLLTE